MHPSQDSSLGVISGDGGGGWMSGDVSAVSKVKVKVMSLKGQRDVDLLGCCSERSVPALKRSGCLSLLLARERVHSGPEPSPASRVPLPASPPTCLLHPPFPVATPSLPSFLRAGTSLSFHFLTSLKSLKNYPHHRYYIHLHCYETDLFHLVKLKLGPH